MYLGASVFSAVLLHKVYLFQTLPAFDNIRQGTIKDMLYYSLPFGIAFTVLPRYKSADGLGPALPIRRYLRGEVHKLAEIPRQE